MVGTGEPKCLPSLHAFVANQKVLDGHKYRMPRMERAVRIRGRHNDGEGLLVPLGELVGVEKAGLKPEFVDTRFDLLGFVGRQEFLVHRLDYTTPSGASSLG